jgi:phosphoenolpyruvate carboxykinase (ATP)
MDEPAQIGDETVVKGMVQANSCRSRTGVTPVSPPKMKTVRRSHVTATEAKLVVPIDGSRVSKNLTAAGFLERALARGEGQLAENGAFVVNTAPCTGRIPNDKFLERTAATEASIAWGKVNKPISPEVFDELIGRINKHLEELEEVFVFEGFAGADAKYRLNVRVASEYAWHALFARTLFIRPTAEEHAGFTADWTVVTTSLEVEDFSDLGLNSEHTVIQSLDRKIVVVLGSKYAGEIKKSIFYAMNYDMPDRSVFPMHCSANVAIDDPDNVALFFGLSGTGKTTLSADPNRHLIGDDEHGWSADGIFNFEGGCYAKCINLSAHGEPQIYNAIRFGSVLENVVIDAQRHPDYDDDSVTPNTRATYPVEFIPGAQIPSIGNHPRNVIFLAADAFGVLPPVARLNFEQAQYYFINGYTSKLAGTEKGITRPEPNFSPCFGGPFLPRPPALYAKMLADRMERHDAHVWLINTGWTGGAYGDGHRFQLKYTRAMVTAILDRTLSDGSFERDPAFGLEIPTAVPGVPSDVLRPRDSWRDGSAYDAQATELARLFRANDASYEMPDNVRAAGPIT